MKHNPPTEADEAFLAADFAKAEGFFKADLSKRPGDAELTAGLVHALLRQQKVQEAADTVKAALAAAPQSASLLTLRGEVELRQGDLWLVQPTVVSAYKLDACNPRTHFLFARLEQADSHYATARQQILLAHQLDPQDAEIRWAWIQTLPVQQRITETEAYLSAPTGDDQATLAQIRADLDRLKARANEPGGACQLVSKQAGVELDFIKLMFNMQHMRALGLEVGLNGNPTRMDFSTSQSGLTVYRAAADRAGLKRVSEPVSGAYPGAKPRYTAHADSIKIDGLEFKDCTVNVIDGGSPFEDGDGMIGLDVFTDFLVTVDFPMRKLLLEPLPARPGDAAMPAYSLLTGGGDDSMMAGVHTPRDRYVDASMKDYTQVYRFGSDLVLPTMLNDKLIKLFIMDTGIQATNISPDAARAVAKVHFMDRPKYGPAAGGPDKLLVADEINYSFAHFSQKLNGVVAFDTSMATRVAGTEISGFIGANTLQLLTIHIDYRDGLVKMDYVPNRGYSSGK
ncbi:MAG: aspartyl protease family protein [Acidobacteriota bacterium]|nr:aspartyl protease family protein [Acidobacteriota bacterium]